MTYDFKLRERKKAQLRLDLVNELIEELEHHSFDEIKVSTLCDKVSISEVTFFKYFEKKDELLQYYMEIWSYVRELKIAKDRKIGKAAVYQLFDDIALTENSGEILNTLISYICKTKVRPKNIQLSLCEKWLINPDLVLENELSLDEQLLKAIDESIADGQLSAYFSPSDYHMMLAAIFYGTPVISHASQGDLKTLYENNLDIIFKEVKNEKK